MLCNEYAYDLAKALIYPELTIGFAADVINGNVFGNDIWDEVCTLTGGWCNDHNVFVAWDKMGRPDESDYIESDYDMERDPDRRRVIIANARIWAMAECVADALYTVVNDILVNEGWKVATEPPGDPAIGWLECGCDALEFQGESWLIKPTGK